MRLLLSGGIAVPAQETRLSEGSGGLLLQFLSAYTQKLYAAALALGTNLRHLHPVITLVTEQDILNRVIAEGNVAAAAGQNVAAVPALNEGSPAPAVEEEHYLLAAGYGFRNSLRQ